jgi:hypothetical protein
MTLPIDANSGMTPTSTETDGPIEAGAMQGTHEKKRESAEPRKRRKSARRQLEDIVKQFDDCLASGELKDGKRADVLIEKASVLKALLQIEVDEQGDETTIENERLSRQHEADVATVAELKAKVEELEVRVREVKTVMVPDPDAPQIKELNVALEELLRLLASRMTSDDARLQMAARVLSLCPAPAAKAFLPMLGLNYAEYAGMMLLHKTERELREVVEQAVNGDGRLSRFARARLAVNHPAAVPAKTQSPSFVPDTRSAEEKIAEAKAMTRRPWEVQTRQDSTRSDPAGAYRDAIDRQMFDGPSDDLFD